MSGETVTYSLEAVLTRIENKIDSFEKRVNDRFDSFEKRTNERFDKVDERFDSFEKRVDERFDKVDERLTKLEIGQAGIKAEVSGLQKRTDDLNGRLNIMTVGFLSVLGVFATAIIGILSKLVFFPNNP